MKVKAGSQGLRITGLILSIVGGSVALSGAITLGLASTSIGDELGSTVKVAGGAMLGVGLGALAAGIPMTIGRGNPRRGGVGPVASRPLGLERQRLVGNCLCMRPGPDPPIEAAGFTGA